MLPSKSDHWYVFTSKTGEYYQTDKYCDETYDGATIAHINSAANQREINAEMIKYYGGARSFWLGYAVEPGVRPWRALP